MQKTITTIQTKVQELDERIENLEQDAVKHHLEDTIFENSDNMEEDSASLSESTTTTTQNTTTQDNTDIHNRQQLIHEQLEKMGSSMSEMLNLFNLTQNSLTIRHLPSNQF
jgi:archaellum component FlaD/FlaE